MQGSFIVYLIGYILIIAGVAFGMNQAGIDQTWVTVTVLVLAGLGIIYAFSRSQRDEAAKRQTSSTSGGSSHQGRQDQSSAQQSGGQGQGGGSQQASSSQQQGSGSAQ